MEILRQIVGVGKISIGRFRFFPFIFIMTYPGTIGDILRVRLAIEIDRRQAIIGIHEQVERDNPFMIVELDNRAFVNPVPDVGNIHQHVSQAILRGCQTTCEWRTPLQMIGDLKTFGYGLFSNVRQVGTVPVNLLPGRAEVAVVLAEQLKITQHHIGVQVEPLVLAVVGVQRAIG